MTPTPPSPPLPLDRALALPTSPAEALLQLAKAVRDEAPLVVMAADPRHDRAHEGEEAAREAVERALGEGATRLIGPASGGVVRGPGTVGVVSALGQAAALLREALGDALGQAVDLGLGWGVSPAEALYTVARLPGIERVALALPSPEPSDEGPARELWRDLPRALRSLQGCLPIVALGASPALRMALEALGVGVVEDLGQLVAACTPSPQEPVRGRRVAVVGSLDPLAAWVPGALEAAGLALAQPSPATLARLESELPRQSQLGGHVRVPNPSQRHLVVAREALAKDPEVDAVWVVGPYLAPPLSATRVLGALAVTAEALAAGPSPLPAPPPTEGFGEAAALLYARRLMRRDRVDRAEALSLLTACAAGPLDTAPAIPVASLAAARDAARHLGYPVLLGPSGVAEPIADDDALVTAWERLLGELAGAPGPTWRGAPDPWATRVITPVRGEIVRLGVSAFPLPRLETSLAHAPTLALPLRERELASLGRLAPVAGAIAALVAQVPEITGVSALLSAEGVVLDANIALPRAERPIA